MPLSPLCSEVRFAALDFESAGAESGETDVPVQIGIARFRLSGQPVLWTSYIASPKPVRWSASKIHGITDETLRNAPSYQSLWPQIKRQLGDSVVVGHNLGTEKRFLRAFPGHGFGPWLDTLVLSRNCYPGLGDYSLEFLCNTMQLVPQISNLVPKKTWHDALFDAVASALLATHIIKALHLENEPLYMLGDAVK